MKILLLSPYPDTLRPALDTTGDTIVCRSEKLAVEDFDGFDAVISYGYAHLLRKPVIDRLPGRILNLHISYLPWNRGAHPNLWSWVDGTPKGVTLHLIDEGVDTGALVIQEGVTFGPDETLASSYAKLRKAIEDLFNRSWPSLRQSLLTEGRFSAAPQVGEGSHHFKREGDALLATLPQGYDTPVATLRAR